MFFVHNIVDDITEILAPMNIAGELGEPFVLSSCINPLVLSLSIAEESSLEASDICETFHEYLEEKGGSDKFGFSVREIDVTTELIAEWAINMSQEYIGINYTDADLLEMVRRKNTEAIHDLFFKDIEAIQIILSPADERGRTMTMAGDFKADSESLVESLRDKFGEFILVGYPVELGIGPTGYRVNQFICHVYNDRNASTSRGMIVQGALCEKCGEFYTIFPGQVDFCCGI